MFEKLYSKCVLVCDGECEQEHTFDTFDIHRRIAQMYIRIASLRSVNSDDR